MSPRDEELRRAHLSHERRLRLLGALWALSGVAIVAWAAGTSEIEGNVRTVYAAFGVASIVLGALLGLLVPGSRAPAAAFAAIGLANFPAGTVISLYTLYLLLSEKGQTVLSREYREIIARTPHLGR